MIVPFSLRFARTKYSVGTLWLVPEVSQAECDFMVV